MILIRQHHGQDAAAGASEGVSDVVILRDRGFGGHCIILGSRGLEEQKERVQILYYKKLALKKKILKRL